MIGKIQKELKNNSKLAEDFGQTDRTHFKKGFLFESPLRLQPLEMFTQICFDINDMKSIRTPEPIVGRSNFFKIKTDLTALYWYEENKKIILGAKFTIERYNLITQIIGKNETWKGKYPFASDLYDVVLKDSEKSVVQSDSVLTDNAFSIWKKLYQLGHKISIYDKLNAGSTFKTFNSIIDMEQYFGDNPDLSRYRYVLSEDSLPLVETRSFFGTRRLRELSGFTED